VVQGGGRGLACAPVSTSEGGHASSSAARARLQPPRPPRSRTWSLCATGARARHRPRARFERRWDNLLVCGVWVGGHGCAAGSTGVLDVPRASLRGQSRGRGRLPRALGGHLLDSSAAGRCAHVPVEDADKEAAST